MKENWVEKATQLAARGRTEARYTSVRVGELLLEMAAALEEPLGLPARVTRRKEELLRLLKAEAAKSEGQDAHQKARE